MKFRNRHMRKFLRGWCAKHGVPFSRKVWLVRKHTKR